MGYWTVNNEVIVRVSCRVSLGDRERFFWEGNNREYTFGGLGRKESKVKSWRLCRL